MNDEIDKILTDWSLKEYIGVFKDNKIDADTLNLLDRDMVAQLIKPIGDRAKFLKNLSLWQNVSNDDSSLSLNLIDSEKFLTNSTNVSILNEEHKTISWSALNLTNFEEIEKPKEIICSTDTSTKYLSDTDSDQTTALLSPQSKNFKNPYTHEFKPLQDILNQSLDGRNILKFHKEEGVLSSNSRRKLCNLIIYDLLQEDINIRIPHEILFKYAQEIKSIFNKENASTYYVPYINNQKMKIKACAKGKLVDCLHNRKRDYRREQKNVLLDKKTADVQDNHHLELNEDLQQNLQWLKNSTEPWELVEKKWHATATFRTTELKTSDKSVAQYMAEFPVLQKPAGYQLLLLDFNHLYPGKGFLIYENFPILKNKILSYAEKKAERDSTLREIFQEKNTFTTNDDVRAGEVNTLRALMALPLLLGNPLAKGRKSTWRPSKQEASEGFITHICTPADLLTTIKRRRDKFQQHNITLQPFIIIIGRDYMNIDKFYVIINDTFYLLHTILDAVDVCFKSFQVLNCRYPIECVSTWQFIQKGVYQIQTPWDKKLCFH
ncbi:hypothetical protein ACJJTC_006795 [Scirpophaga incertulas]